LFTAPSSPPLKGTCPPAAVGSATPRMVKNASVRPAAERKRFILSLLVVCDYYGETSLPARRPSARAVPGRRGACLAVRAPPAACSPVGFSASGQTHHLTVVAAAQVLVSLVIDSLAQEMNRAVGEGEVDAAVVTGLEAVGHIRVREVSFRRGGATVRAEVIGVIIEGDDRGDRPAWTGEGPMALTALVLPR